MVCVSEERRVQCIVRDVSHIRRGQDKYEVTLPASTPVAELIHQVASKMGYKSNAFQLILQKPDASVLTLTESTSGSLEEVGFSTELHSRNSLLLQGMKVVGEKSGAKRAGVGGPPSPSPSPTVYLLPPPAPASAATAPTAGPAGDYISPHDTGYVGLVNQAMTCYLNSLLQALYMTPEFRNALYKWKFDTSHNNNAAKCIPFQLQRLFLNLQTSSKSAVETTELTRSFGWESGEVWQQHDIQELCRVMFDALEQEFKDTQQADLINQLYQGKMIDYVKCLECEREKSREDTFLDIPLPVRPFGSTIAYGSIVEALRAFVQPERLEGNNQYLCESCNKKCDAHKGLKFSKFPYLLTLHLKRFDFDYSTMHRIKLNDKVVFPEVLDLNSFVGSSAKVEDETRCDDSSTGDSALDEELASQPPDSNSTHHDQEEDEGIDMSTSSGTQLESKIELSESSPFVYELYSIMIHSGSASGGHYYAYIKDFAKGEWFCFNDQSVTRITQEDIMKTYGGGPSRGYYSGAYSSSTNAYMLMYRQLDKERNCPAITEHNFPPHLMKLLEEMRQSEETERALRARQEEMLRIKVYSSYPQPGIFTSTKLFCYNDTTLHDFTYQAHQELRLEGVVPIEQCRLVSYSHTQDQMKESFDGRETETMSQILASYRNPANYEMFCEIRQPHQNFIPYTPKDICVSVYRVDLNLEEVVGVEQVRTSPCECSSTLSTLLEQVLPLPTPPPPLHIVLAKPTGLVLISDEQPLPLNKLGFQQQLDSSSRVFVCPKEDDPEVSKCFQTSKLYRFLEKVQNVIILYFVLPDSSPDALECLLIPPLISEEKVNGNNNRHIETTPPGDKELGNGSVGEEEVVCAGTTSDQSTSEDSSLTDSERTIIGEPNECQLSSQSDSDQQLSSPETQPPVKINDMNGEMEENWDEDDDDETMNKIYYFKCSPFSSEDGKTVVRVVVDRNIQMRRLKKKVEGLVGVEGTYLKLVRERTEGELSSSIASFKDHERVQVKLYRPLQDGEARIKIYLLHINDVTPMRYICDWIVTKSTSVATTKKAILKELEKRHNIKIPYERCRMWRKNWKSQSPGKVVYDGQVWEEDIGGTSQKELFLEELDCDETLPRLPQDERVLFVRRWHPSTLSLSPFTEIVLNSTSTADFADKLSELSGIPSENIKFAKGMSPFPCEMSVLNIHTELDWDHNADSLMDWKLSITDDGVVVFYKDDREKVKALSKEEQDEVSQRESARLSTNCGSSPRKEKALKIYLDTKPPARSFIDID